MRGLLSLLSAAFIAALSLNNAVAQSGSHPNVILIVADDLGIGEPGCYGGDIPTPNIDRLAAEGTRFTAGYVTAPFCAASRAALLTSRYQTRFGFEFNPIGPANSDPQIGLPPAEKTIADELRNQGYVTGLVGKWHLGGSAKYHPQRCGFDEFFGFLHEGHYYVPPPFDGHLTWLRRRALPDGSTGRWTSPDGRTIWTTHMRSFEPDYDADNPLLRSSQPVDERANLTDAFTRESVSFIRRRSQQPFFLCLAYNAVHSPMQAKDEDLAKLQHIEDVHRRLFAAMLMHLDRGIGDVLNALTETGVDRKTLVIFLSDNGGAVRELTSSNRPFRGQKGELLEGGIRVPMLMRWPGTIPAGLVDSRMVSSMDLSATALAAAGKLPPNLDGIDLAPFLKERRDEPIRQGLYWRVGDHAAYRSGDWKIHTRAREAGLAALELYNLADDPGEAQNLASARPELVRRLEAEWSLLNSKMVAPLWPGPTRRGPVSDSSRSARPPAPPRPVVP
jgi:arylsulfatase A-like enzyme